MWVHHPGFFNSESMDTKNTTSRRRFLWFGAGTALAVTFFSLPGLFRKKAAASQTTKMLTQDGVLVEVDVARIRKNKKATNQELQTWIKR